MSTAVGPDYAGTGANNNDGGNVAWTNPTNAQGAADGVLATCNLSAALKSSQQLRCSNYGFAIPAGVTIVGILVEFDRKASTAAVSDSAVKLLIGGVGPATARRERRVGLRAR